MRAMLPIGPFDSLMRMPALLECEIEGRTVVAASFEHSSPTADMAHAFEGLTPCDAAVLASYSCARSAVHHAAAFCEAVERAHGIEVDDSRSALRVVLSEWTRIASHLEAISDIGLALEDDLVYGRPRRYLATIRAAIDSACSNPFGFGAIVPGGVELAGDAASIGRLDDIARVLAKDCAFWGGKLSMSGPRLKAARIEARELPEGHPPATAFRASGSRADLRAGEDALIAYVDLDYRPVVRDGGTSLDRARVLLGEVVSSLGLIEKAARAAGEYDGPPEAIGGGKGSSSGTWESPHGALEYRVLMGAEGRVMRVRSFGASRDVAELAEVALQGVAFEDVAVTIASLNICERCLGA